MVLSQKTPCRVFVLFPPRLVFHGAGPGPHRPPFGQVETFKKIHAGKMSPPEGVRRLQDEIDALNGAPNGPRRDANPPARLRKMAKTARARPQNRCSHGTFLILF